MTKREKVIEALEACVLKDPDDSRDCKHCPRCNYGAFITNSCINGVMVDALALLKAQEPVKPKDVIYDDVHRLVHCPSCDNRLAGLTYSGAVALETEETPNYCWMCGQAVKWE